MYKTKRGFIVGCDITIARINDDLTVPEEIAKKDWKK